MDHKFFELLSNKLFRDDLNQTSNCTVVFGWIFFSKFSVILMNNILMITFSEKIICAKVICILISYNVQSKEDIIYQPVIGTIWTVCIINKTGSNGQTNLSIYLRLKSRERQFHQLSSSLDPDRIQYCHSTSLFVSNTQEIN